MISTAAYSSNDISWAAAVLHGLCTSHLASWAEDFSVCCYLLLLVVSLQPLRDSLLVEKPIGGHSKIKILVHKIESICTLGQSKALYVNIRGQSISELEHRNIS